MRPIGAFAAATVAVSGLWGAGAGCSTFEESPADASVEGSTDASSREGSADTGNPKVKCTKKAGCPEVDNVCCGQLGPAAGGGILAAECKPEALCTGIGARALCDLTASPSECSGAATCDSILNTPYGRCR